MGLFDSEQFDALENQDDLMKIQERGNNNQKNGRMKKMTWKRLIHQNAKKLGEE